MDKQKVLAKVEKLMALANAKGATPNEAETALRQAAILKRQFDLSDAEISAHTVETACVMILFQLIPSVQILRSSDLPTRVSITYDLIIAPTH